MAVPSSFGGGGSSYGGGDSSGSGVATNFLGIPQPTSPADREVLPNRQILAGVARLLHGTKDQQDQARRFLEDNDQLFSDDDLAQYGIPRMQKDSRSLFEKVAGAGLSALSSVGKTLARPQQAVAHGLHAIGTGIGEAGLAAEGKMSAGDVLGDLRHNAAETWRAATDVSGAHDINTRQMLNLNKDAGADPNAKTIDPFGNIPVLGKLEFHGGYGGLAAGAGDLAGSMATDPLMYVSGISHGKEAMKAGLNLLDRASPGIAEKITRGTATAEEIAAAREAAKQIGLEEAERVGTGQRTGKLAKMIFGDGTLTKGGPFSRFKEGALAAAAGEDARTGLSRFIPKGTGLEGAERVVERNLNAAIAGGERGLKFGGQTILSRDTLAKPFVATKLMAGEKLVDNLERTNVLKAIEDNAAKLTKAREAARTVGQADPKLQATIADLETQAASLHEKLASVQPKTPITADITEPVLHNKETGEYRVAAKVDGKNAGEVLYRVDDKGQVQIEAAQSMPGQKRNGVMDQLLGKVEEATGQHRTAFGPGAQVEPGAEQWWQKVTGQTVDPETGQVTGRAPVEAPAVPESGALPEGAAPQTPLPEGYLPQRLKYTATKALTETEQKLAQAHEDAWWQTTENVRKHVEGLNEQLDKAAQSRQAVKDARAAAEQEVKNWRDLRAEKARLRQEASGLRARSPERAAVNARIREVTEKLNAAKERVEGAKSALADSRDAVIPAADVAPIKAQLREVKPKLGELLARDEAAKAAADAGIEKYGSALRAHHELIEGGLMPEQVYKTVPGKLTPTRNLLRNLFVGDAGIEDTSGARARDFFKSAEERMHGASRAGTEDAIRTLENVAEPAYKENPAFGQEIRERIYPAFETEGGVPKLLDELRAEGGREKAIQYVEVAAKMRAEAEKMKLGTGLLDEAMLHNSDTYMQRVMTPEAQQAYRDYTSGRAVAQRNQPSSKFLEQIDPDGTLKARTIGAELPVGPELQDAARKELQRMVPDFKGDVYDTNVSSSLASSMSQAHSMKAAKNFLDELADFRDSHGVPLVTRDESVGKTLDMVPVQTIGGDLYATPEVAKSLNRYEAVTTNDQALRQVQGAMGKIQGLWKAQATVPLIGFGFHARNAETNVMLNWIAGLENPTYYARALKLQRKLAKLSEQLGVEGGATHLDELIDKSDQLTDQEKFVLKAARRQNVIQHDYVGRGLESGSPMEKRLAVEKPNNVRRILNKANVFDQDTALGVPSGRAVGRNIENNARLAHFMWAMDDLGDEAAAADSVKKYLFNYDDLTPTEKRIKSKYIPFYTFMRKNTALMAQTLLENPGKLRRMTMADDATKKPNAPWLEGKLIPGYQVQQNEAPRLGLPANVIGAMETPLGTAEETIRPLVETAGELPGTNRLVPDAFKNREGMQGALTGLVNLPGGPGAEAAKQVIEHAYQVDTFTGGKLGREGFKEKALDLTGIFAPSPSKLDRVTQNITLSEHPEVKGAERTSRRQAIALNSIFGLLANAVGPASSEAERISRFYALQDYIEQQNRGLKVGDPRRLPTLTELRDAGYIPGSGSGATNFLGI